MQYPAIALSLLLSLPALADDEQLPPDTCHPCLKESIATYQQAKADNPDLPHKMLIAIGSARYHQCIDEQHGSLIVGSAYTHSSEPKP